MAHTGYASAVVSRWDLKPENLSFCGGGPNGEASIGTRGPSRVAGVTGTGTKSEWNNREQDRYREKDERLNGKRTMRRRRAAREARKLQ